MMEIGIGHGIVAIVDDDDYPVLSSYVWHAHKAGRTVYARRNPRELVGETSSVFMHRQIMGLKKTDLVSVDHIDRNGLNNRKSNLRIATKSENAFNSNLRSDNTSGYRGVWWEARKRRWASTISHNGNRIWVGYFKTSEAASAAYQALSEQLQES